MSTPGNVQEITAQNPESKSERKLNVDLCIKIVTVLCLFGGLVWSLVTYKDKKNQEYEFTLYKERKEMYFPLCRAAAEIVSSKSLADAASAIKTFETLYYAGVRSVAEKDVNEAINDFEEALFEYKNGADDGPPPPELITLCNELEKKSMKALDLQRVFGVGKESKGDSDKAPPETSATEPAPEPN